MISVSFFLVLHIIYDVHCVLLYYLSINNNNDDHTGIKSK